MTALWIVLALCVGLVVGSQAHTYRWPGYQDPGRHRKVPAGQWRRETVGLFEEKVYEAEMIAEGEAVLEE